jgi:hypothetical protein
MDMDGGDDYSLVGACFRCEEEELVCGMDAVWSGGAC